VTDEYSAQAQMPRQQYGLIVSVRITPYRELNDPWIEACSGLPPRAVAGPRPACGTCGRARQHQEPPADVGRRGWCSPARLRRDDCVAHLSCSYGT
jgi:hypothetical protein